MPDFTLAPPLDGDWTPLDPDTRDLLAERLRDYGVVPRNTSVSAIRVLRLPFYADILLCDGQILTEDGPGAMLSFLYGRDGVRALTGRSEVIHDLNAQKQPDLGEPAIQEAYLKFFCAFVHGGDGPFEIVTSDAQLDPEDAPPAHPIEPPQFHAESGLWKTTVLYGTALFEADFSVGADGNVKMERDALIRQDVMRRPRLVFDGAARQMKEETRHDV